MCGTSNEIRNKTKLYCIPQLMKNRRENWSNN